MNKKASLLIFAHHSKGYISLNTEAYVKELSQYFTNVVFATTHSGFLDLPYKIIRLSNKGYDFGLFYRTIKKIKNLERFERIVFANDSNSLVGKFDNVFEWGSKTRLDMWGLTDSIQGHPKLKNSLKYRYHVQSHFLVFEKKAIPHLFNFFDFIKFEKNILRTSKDLSKLREEVILACEYGLSHFMSKQKLKIGAMYSVKNWKPILGRRGQNKKGDLLNMHFHKWEELIKDGYPLIKNKIINGEWSNPQTNLVELVPNGKRWRKYAKNNTHL
jgi:hypothetical protein